MDSYISNFVGKPVLMKLSKQFIDEASAFLQPQHPVNLLYGVLVAVDQLGLWIENPRWKAEDVKARTVNEFTAHFLVPWSAVLSAAAFPTRHFESDRFPAEKDAKSIGFHAAL